MCLACWTVQLCHWERCGSGRVGYLTKCHGDCFVQRAEDGQVVTGFVEMTSGLGIKESSFHELGGVATVNAASLLADMFP